MSETKHSKGPWQIVDVDGYIEVRTLDGFEVCGIGDMEVIEGEDLANARLIATAPDMLAALEAITSNPHLDLGDLVYQVRERECQGWEGDAVRQWSEAVTSVKEAIRKAKGQA